MLLLSLVVVYCSVEKLMHQRPYPIDLFFQREMARVEKMELCAWDIFFVEFRALHRKDSIVLAQVISWGVVVYGNIPANRHRHPDSFLRYRGLKVGYPCSPVGPDKPGPSPNCQG